MKFKNLMLITLLLLAVLTIGAVSATEDVGALTVDDTGDETIVEAPVDEKVVETPTADEDVVGVEESSDDLNTPDTDLDNINGLTPEDFNVTFPNTEFDIDKGDPVVITYFTPDGITQYSSDIVIYYGDGDFDRYVIQMELNDVGTYKNITWGEMYIMDVGVYNLTVYYSIGLTDFLELGSAIVNVSDNHEYTAEDIIHIYSPVSTDTGFDEDCLADIYDEEIGGLDGVVNAYANGTQIYSKSYSKSNRGGPIHAKDLASYFNGVYDIKIEYKRTDGKVFTLNKNVYFDDVVGGESISTIIAVKPASVSMAYGANKVLVATLTDSNGSPIKGELVYISVMGISYPIMTDNNGQVKQSLSSLPPKTSHIVTFTFKETAPYKESSGKAEVKVTKAATKSIASNKAFKKSVKTKKYTVTLKTSENKAINGVNVKLTVNKKTYTVKTNSKGQALFKITNLKKKGTFKATVKFTGNSYYKASSKTAKITIK